MPPQNLDEFPIDSYITEINGCININFPEKFEMEIFEKIMQAGLRLFEKYNKEKNVILDLENIKKLPRDVLNATIRGESHFTKILKHPNFDSLITIIPRSNLLNMGIMKQIMLYLHIDHKWKNFNSKSELFGENEA